MINAGIYLHFATSFVNFEHVCPLECNFYYLFTRSSFQNFYFILFHFHSKYSITVIKNIKNNGCNHHFIAEDFPHFSKTLVPLAIGSICHDTEFRLLHLSLIINVHIY